MTENYDNVKYLKNYQGSVFILHRANDTIISPKYSKKLFDSLKTPRKEYISIPRAGHNDLYGLDDLKVRLLSSSLHDFRALFFQGPIKLFPKKSND